MLTFDRIAHLERYLKEILRPSILTHTHTLYTPSNYTRHIFTEIISYLCKAGLDSSLTILSWVSNRSHDEHVYSWLLNSI